MTKVFIDTNIFIEYFDSRPHIASVRHIFNAIEDRRVEAYLSGASYYTIVYLIEKVLKRHGVFNPERLAQMRSWLLSVLDLAQIANMPHHIYQLATTDNAFTDIEDSLQYHCARANHCDVLITINLKDFALSDTSQIKIMSPEQFVNEYLP